MRELPARKPNRLEGYDYSRNGAYFVTICTKDRLELLSRVVVGAATCRPQEYFHTQERPHAQIELTQSGNIVEAAICQIPIIYTDWDVAKYVIMPNHVHLILTQNGRQIAAPTVSQIIGNMKRAVFLRLGYSLWQKSFHDHIIRNQEDYNRIVEYIENNPQNWEQDCFYHAQ